MGINKRLKQQIEFIVEVDKLKTIMRQTRLIHENRYENDAEHSWHLALAVLVFSEYANEPLDLLKVLKMVLVHDLVEIDAGDTFCYDYAAAQDKEKREAIAAERIFGLLPADQKEEFKNIWEEFERVETAEARFAAAMDRFQPVLHNLHNQGGTWKEHNIKKEQVIKRNSPIANGSQELWAYIEKCLTEVQKSGIIKQWRDE